MTKERQTRLLGILGLTLAILAALGWALTAVPAITQTGSGVSATGETAVTGLIPDGSFEEVPSLWTESNITAACDGYNQSAIGSWAADAGLTPLDGPNSFMAGGYCNNTIISGTAPVRSNEITQSLAVPPDVTGLSFWFAAFTDQTPLVTTDTLYVQISVDNPPQGYVLRQINVVPEILDKGWLREVIDISPFAGKVITLSFELINSDAEFASAMLIDKVEWTRAPHTDAEIDPAMGGQLKYYGPKGLTTEVIVPPGAVTKTKIIRYEPAAGPGYPLNSASPLGTSAAITYAGIAFDLDVATWDAYLPFVTSNGGGAQVFGLETAAPQSAVAADSFIFEKPISITIYYDDSSLPPGVTESQLYLYFWDPATQTWQDAADTCAPAQNYVRDPINNNTFTLQVCHFSRFSVVGV